MGRTVPSFRIAAEIERTKWKQFRSYLDKKDRKEFDQMYYCVRLHNTACMMACRPVVIHAVLMSIIFLFKRLFRQPTYVQESRVLDLLDVNSLVE